jgi:alpha-beta hydrolase superfamily lysophospholipase
MERFILPNRHGEKIIGIVDVPSNPHGMAIIMHGLGGHKEEHVLETVAHTFVNQGIVAVRFDATKGLGESDGKYEDATTTNFIEDLEDVIGHTELQPWFREPFYLAGHSLGGLATTVYAQKHKSRVKALAPIATVVSGNLTAEVRGPEYIETWRRNGRRREQNPNIPGLKWEHMEDRFRYDLLPDASDLSMPILMVVGENDTHTPVPHQKILFERIAAPKELHILQDAQHELDSPRQNDQIKTLFSSWISRVEAA